MELIWYSFKKTTVSAYTIVLKENRELSIFTERQVQEY
jgi:hypothetical protein